MSSFAFRPEAEAEIAQAVDWYETRRKGLGAEFLRSLDAALTAIALNPKSYPEIFGRARRAVMRRFPYSLVYALSDTNDDILVVACFQARAIRIIDGREARDSHLPLPVSRAIELLEHR